MGESNKQLLQRMKHVRGHKYVYKYSYKCIESFPFYTNERIRVKLPNSKYLQYKIKGGRVPKSVKEALPLYPTSCGRYIGNVKVPVGFTPQKIYHLSQWFNRKELKPFVAKLIDADTIRVHVSGAWPTQVETFQEWMNPVISKTKAEQYLAAGLKRFKYIKLPQMGDIVDDSIIYGVGTNPTSSPGFMSSRLFGSSHKEADSWIKPIAADLFNEIMSGNKLADCSIWSVGGRGRNFDITKIGESLQSRIVVMPEGPPKIINLAISTPFMRKFVEINKKFAFNEIGIGVDFLNGNYSKFSKTWDKFHELAECDWSRFDSTADAEILIAAWCVLRSCWPKGDHIDRLFMYMASGFINKSVVVPGGFVYRVTRSIPSGSPWTTAIGCIVNWLAWCRILEDEPSHCWRVICYGDDTQLGFRNSFIPNEDYILRKIQERSTLIAKKLTIMDNQIGYLRDDYLTNGITLLKAYSIAGLPARRFKDYAESILYGGSSKRTARSFRDIWMAMKGAYYNSPFNPEVRSFHLEMMKVVHKLYWSERFCGNANVLYNNKDFDKFEKRTEGFGIVRYLSEKDVLTPKVQNILPWLDKEKYFEKTFLREDNNVTLLHSLLFKWKVKKK